MVVVLWWCFLLVVANVFMAKTAYCYCCFRRCFGGLLVGRRAEVIAAVVVIFILVMSLAEGY